MAVFVADEVLAVAHGHVVPARLDSYVKISCDGRAGDAADHKEGQAHLPDNDQYALGRRKQPEDQTR